MMVKENQDNVINVKTMAIANPRLHIICGICGNNKMLKFTVKNGEVTIICDNCSSITGLDEVIPKEKK